MEYANFYIDVDGREKIKCIFCPTISWITSHPLEPEGIRLHYCLGCKNHMMYQFRREKAKPVPKNVSEDSFKKLKD